MEELIELMKSEGFVRCYNGGVTHRYVEDYFGCDYMVSFTVHYKAVNEIEIYETRDMPPFYECDYEVTGIEDLEVFCLGKRMELTEEQLAEIINVIYVELAIY